jgi:hypothetical protein
MVVFVILSIALAKKFVSTTTADIWCVQMSGATKLVATTFVE